ncbi:MAG TPA: hypothetical protein DEP20_00725 [Fusobacteria bacterium]|nr:hypothetical protein [Fusobacteriota bacterium]|tara:strand:- start:5833 stop:6420 length:588 start_codon:yes stop_codon:yes gene_type:complete
MKLILKRIDDFDMDYLKSNISPERVRRALMFRDEKDQKRHMLGEVALRIALKEFGHRGSFNLSREQLGKPKVDVKGFHFNISHSGKYVVLAYSDTEIGVDIEMLRERRISFYRDKFHPVEIEYVDSSANKLKAFYEIWTLKESYLKAIGMGLNCELNQFYIIPTKSGEYTTSLTGLEVYQKFGPDYVISVSKLIE